MSKMFFREMCLYVTLIGFGIVGACSNAQDAATVQKVNTTVTLINADVAAAASAIVLKVNQVCPGVVKAAPAAEVTTTAIAAFLGFPETGAIVVGLETSAAKWCSAKATAQTTTTASGS